MKTIYRVGLDVGSTTIKCVVLEGNTVRYQSYERHRARVREKATKLLQYIEENIVHGAEVFLSVTGSSGLGLSQENNIPFVQEVYATQLAIKQYYPNVDVVIELGGEDAKILFLSGVLEVRMNGSCAGGTGSFIDQMATLLGVDLDEFDKLSLSYQKLYTIASRCGVFAKSDIQPLINQGAQKNDLAASIFQAVVNQTISGLAQGKEITGTVAFLGGPLTFFQGLRARFVETLGLQPDTAVFPENGQYFIALGAALYASNTTNPCKLSAVLSSLSKQQKKKITTTIPPLFENEQEYNDFLKRQNQTPVAYRNLSDYQGEAYLGIDAGSTTTKIVLISPKGEILYQKYISNSGDAIPIVRNALTEIYQMIENGDNKVTICGSASTGYGEELMQHAFSLDFGLVETVAHFTAARYFMPSVDFIIDIGGQDMKCFKLKNNAVDSIMLNEACSSGCGSFLETFATAMGYKVDEFAKEGLFAKHPVDLGSRCTVFMNSSVKQAQKDGATIADISAGLSISIVKNAVYKVIRAHSPKELGQNIVVQGGTFLNDAVLRAFEKELGINVIRTPVSGLMGAYGCALYAMHNRPALSSTITQNKLQNFVHTVTTATCQHCENHCRLTINRFADGKNYISGNKCDRYTGKQTSQTEYNLMAYRYHYLTHLPTTRPTRSKIGIPLVLNMYENLPFWHAFFDTLGFEVVLSPRSSRKLYSKGQHTIPSDTVCYPAKLVHGHIEALLEQDVDAIFYPCMSYNFDEGISDNHYNCPVVAYYPEVIEANVPAISSCAFMMDYLGIDRKKDFLQKAYTVFSNYFLVTKQEIKQACQAAYQAYEDYHTAIRRYAEKAMTYAQVEDRPIIVLAGRPYHIDPEINHGIDRLISGYGAVVLTEDVVAQLAHQKQPTAVLNQWTYHARLYAAASVVARFDNMNLVQLISFGCGVDAITSDEVRSILEKHGKLYTMLKIDEINNLGATKIRIRSLFAAIEERKRHCEQKRGELSGKIDIR